MTKKIGTRIREIRKQKNMSLNQLAKKAGLASSFLSQVERNLNSLSVKSLRAIAMALDVPAFNLIESPQKEMIVRKGKRPVIHLPHTGQSYELLSPNELTPIRLLRLKLEPGISNAEKPMQHNGSEIIFVLKGTINANINDKEYVLNEGDTILFESANPHYYYNDSSEEVEVLIATTMTKFIDANNSVSKTE